MGYKWGAATVLAARNLGYTLQLGSSGSVQFSLSFGEAPN